MDIYLLNSTFELYAVVDSFESLIWRRRCKEPGNFELHFPKSSFADYSQARYVYRGDREEIGIVEQMGFSDGKAYIKGRFLEALLDNYVVYPGVDYSSKTPEYIIKTTVAAVTGIFCQPLHGYGTNISSSKRGYSLLDYVYDVLWTQALRPKLTYNFAIGRLEFDIVEAKDRTRSQTVNPLAVFSDDYGNIGSVKYDYSEKDLKNFAYVAGAGEGAARTIVTVDLSGSSPKRALWVDARDLQQEEGTTDAQYAAQLYQRGVEKLAEQVAVQSFDAEIVPDADIVYLNDYDVGDLVTCNDISAGLTFNARPTEIEEAYEGNGLTLTATLGEGYLTIPQYMKRRYS